MVEDEKLDEIYKRKYKDFALIRRREKVKVKFLYGYLLKTVCSFKIVKYYLKLTSEMS